MNSVLVARTIRALALLLLASLVLCAFTGCGEDDPVKPKKVTNKVLQLDGDQDYLSIPIANHTFATFTIEAMVKVSTYIANVHYVSLYQNVYLVLGDWAAGQISTWASGSRCRCSQTRRTVSARLAVTRCVVPAKAVNRGSAGGPGRSFMAQFYPEEITLSTAFGSSS